MRSFAAESWERVPAPLWQQARDEARALLRDDIPGEIIGTDVDIAALGLARKNAIKAGVQQHIRFERRPFAELNSDAQYGCVICNPPYGERLGERDEVEALYRSMPHVLRRLQTWSHYILAAHPQFEALVGQSADRRRKLFNGRIECVLYQFYGPRPGTPSGLSTPPPRTSQDQKSEIQSAGENAVSSPPVAAASLNSANKRTAADHDPAAERSDLAKPAFGGLTAKAYRQAELFRTRLARRARHFRRWPTKQGITCYQLYDRDIPEIPLVVDRYDECLHIADLTRPHEQTPAEHADWLDLMSRTAGEVLEVPPENVFTKRRRRQRPDDQYRRVAQQERIFVVEEGGLKFRVNLSDYLDTGLFLDHRITRSMVRELAAGKRFLNLFGYTGSFTVYAAAGNAESTTTVDLSNTYLEWTQQNLELNGFTGEPHFTVRSDAMAFLKRPLRRGVFDLAVVDPPTFSNSKRLETTWDVQRDHVELLSRLVPWISPGGVILFSTNFRKFRFAGDEISDVSIREITQQTVPPDFRNRRVHRCWRIVCCGDY